MNRKFLWALLPAAALMFSLTASAGSNPDADDRLEQARRDLRAAQEEMQRAAQELARASGEVQKNSPKAWAWEYMTNPHRAVIGVIIDSAPERNRVSPGVIVEAVTPGGGADKAGIKSGDIIVAANGVTLSAKRGDPQPPEHKLMAVMAKLEPGQSLKLDYERDGQRASTVAVTQRPDPSAMHAFHDDPDSDVLVPVPPMAPVPPVPPVPAVPDIPPIPPVPPTAQVLRWSAGGPDFQLAKLDDDLAGYFKTRSGVLVVKAPKDGKLGLKSGDVIQKVGGQTTDDPRAIFDALHRLTPGGKVRLEVVRAGKAVSLDGVVPERPNRVQRVEIDTVP
ncbi:MAG: PDZ domain-containing protein [Nevskiaceae bacterium]|nr:MAG: PDZ domain-containing protein [Nevskiaceae bacterium]